MDCRTRAAYKFRTRLGFKQIDFLLTKEGSFLKKIKKKKTCKCNLKEKTCKHNLVYWDTGLIYIFMTMNLYQQQEDNKQQHKNLVVLQLIPTKKTLVFFKISMKCLEIKQSSNQLNKRSNKKLLIDKISIKLLRLEFNPDNMIK